jgi:type IV pilus assembly protein PilM
MSVGIDIGSKTIKMVELEKEGNAFKLKGSGVVAYSGASIEHLNDEKDMAVLAQVIAKLHKEANISSKEVKIALPETQVFTRTIKFPLLTDQEIASAVKWEAEQYIPIPVNEAIVQHQVIERKENTTPPEVSVLLVAAPRKLVEKYVKVLQLAKLSVEAVETELISLVRSLAPDKQTSLLIDFGARSTNMAIAKNAQLVFSRSVPTAGEAFTRALAQGLGIEYQQAEQYKRAYGFATNQLEGKISATLSPVFKMVSDEMRKAIHYYQSEEKGDPPTSAIISGGTAGMPEVISALSKNLGIEVIIANPFAKVRLSEAAAKSLAGYAPLYSIAVGLALREE